MDWGHALYTKRKIPGVISTAALLYNIGRADNIVAVRDFLTERFLNFEFAVGEHEGVIVPLLAKESMPEVKSFDIRDDDTWIVTYPKAGTTWVQEIVSCVMHDGNLAEVNKRHTTFRVPYFEQDIPEALRRPKNIPTSIKIVAEMPSPRVIKSHLPGQFLPEQIWEKQVKVVYVLRNPKDVIVSYFYFTKLFDPEKIEHSFAEFFEEMLAGKVLYGHWWQHYLYFWKRRHEPNILLLRFEDMKRDLRESVKRISQFLGKEFPNDVIDAITKHCKFASMSTNEMASQDTLYKGRENPTGTFMRKGKVGDWKSHFTVAQNETMDALIREKLHGTGLTFEC